MSDDPSADVLLQRAEEAARRALETTKKSQQIREQIQMAERRRQSLRMQQRIPAAVREKSSCILGMTVALVIVAVFLAIRLTVFQSEDDKAYIAIPISLAAVTLIVGGLRCAFGQQDSPIGMPTIIVLAGLAATMGDVAIREIAKIADK